MSEHLLLLGDSVTVGAGFSGVCERTRFAALLARQLEHDCFSIRVSTSALDGVDTDYALRRFDRMVARFTPDSVAIMLGLNDARPPGRRAGSCPDTYAENVSRLVQRCMDMGASPLLATPTPRWDRLHPNGTQVMEPYAEQVRQVADTFYLPLVDMYAAFIDRGQLASLIPDGIHPGPAGHELIAGQFHKAILEMNGGESRFARLRNGMAASTAP